MSVDSAFTNKTDWGERSIAAGVINDSYAASGTSRTRRDKSIMHRVVVLEVLYSSSTPARAHARGPSKRHKLTQESIIQRKERSLMKYEVMRVRWVDEKRRRSHHRE